MTRKTNCGGTVHAVVRNISLPFTEPAEEACAAAVKYLGRLVPRASIGRAVIAKRSVDARRRGNIRFLYSVDVEVDSTAAPVLSADHSVSLLPDSADEVRCGSERLSARPVIVGFGPAGMFASLTLAALGYAPLVIERGGSVGERVAAVEHFYRTGELDTGTNIQFGAGGAGTFSDGKLTTRIGDPRCRGVLKMLHSLGAPEDILTSAKPHIGTDILRRVVENAAERLTELGGEIRYHTALTELPMRSGEVGRIMTDGGEIECGAVVLAVGHSARDTYSMIMRRGYEVVPKAFSMGLRIEHLREDIDRSLYGDDAGHPLLPPAEYAMSRHYGERTAYTFCMCPGGEVVAASSEEGLLAVNGMSRYARDGRNSNSAVLVSIAASDTPDGQIELQRRYERAAFLAGGGRYRAPVQTVGDFMSGGVNALPSRVLPTYMGGGADKVTTADLSEVVSGVMGAEALDVLRCGIRDFARQISCFNTPDALLTGVESRTSAPVRILRGDTFTAIGADNVYPCGEGAGYAGGIMSAAADGIRCAEAIISRYAPFD